MTAKSDRQDDDWLTDRWMNEWMSAWMSGWMDEWVTGSKCVKNKELNLSF